MNDDYDDRNTVQDDSIYEHDDNYDANDDADDNSDDNYSFETRKEKETIPS